MTANIVYLRMKKQLTVTEQKRIDLKDIAYLSATGENKQDLETFPLYHITKHDYNVVVIDGFMVIDYLRKQYPGLEFQLIGPFQTIVRVQLTKRRPSILLAVFVWLLLFVGAAMTIMNFHYDVSMQAVQQKLHYILTGKKNSYPLWIQIPYSLGLGGGMLLFFNHWFKKRFDEEPSPLEIELFKYQESMNQHVTHYENNYND